MSGASRGDIPLACPAGSFSDEAPTCLVTASGQETPAVLVPEVSARVPSELRLGVIASKGDPLPNVLSPVLSLPPQQAYGLVDCGHWLQHGEHVASWVLGSPTLHLLPQFPYQCDSVTCTNSPSWYCRCK